MASNSYAAPVSGDGGTPGAYPVFFTPVSVIVVRGFQAFIGFIIMVLAGLLMHGLVLSPCAFALVCGLFTLVIVAYALLTEKLPACRAAYNYWAILALDLLMVIFWLASMGAVAALRGTFQFSTSAECVDDGSTFNADTCFTSKKRDVGSVGGGLTKRYAVAGQGALAEMSAIAGLSALEMLLFIGSFGYLAFQVRRNMLARKAGIASDDAGVVEMKGNGGWDTATSRGGDGGLSSRGGDGLLSQETVSLADPDTDAGFVPSAARNDDASAHQQQQRNYPFLQPQPYETPAYGLPASYNRFDAAAGSTGVYDPEAPTTYGPAAAAAAAAYDPQPPSPAHSSSSPTTAAVAAYAYPPAPNTGPSQTPAPEYQATEYQPHPEEYQPQPDEYDPQYDPRYPTDYDQQQQHQHSRPAREHYSSSGRPQGTPEPYTSKGQSYSHEPYYPPQ